MTQDPLPTFVIVGAAKAGTTTLFYALKRHPEVFVPEVKEPNFFSYDPDGLVRPGSGPGDRHATHWTTSSADYRRLFAGRRPGQATGEASVSYLYSPVAAERIRAASPQAKIIALLREPSERAWSQYLHMVRDGRETLSFAEALAGEEARIAQGWEFGWHYRSMGLYADAVERLYRHFPGDRVRLYRFDDLMQDPAATLADVLAFLGLRDDVALDPGARHNRSGEVRSKLLARVFNRPSRLRSALRDALPSGFAHAMMEAVRRLNMKEGKPAMPASVRAELRRFYRHDIERVQRRSGLDLSRWLD